MTLSLRVVIAMSSIPPDQLMEAVSAWALAFLLTLSLEAPIYWYALRVDRAGARLSRSHRVVSALMASGFTHPFIWWVLPPLCIALGFSTLSYIMIAESVALFIEALLLWTQGCRRPLLNALIANGISSIIGSLFFYKVIKVI